MCCSEDGPIPLRNGYPGPFEVTDVRVQRIVTSRDSEGRVSISFGHTELGACEWALIGATSDI